MGICRTCNNDAGWLKHECDGCRSKREAAEAAQKAAERAAAERERQATIDSMVEAALTELKAVVEGGGTAHLYDCVVLNLRDGWIDHAGLDHLRDLGERGWQVVSLSPHVRISKNTERAVSNIELDQTQVLVDLPVASWNRVLLDGEIRAHCARRAAEEVAPVR